MSLEKIYLIILSLNWMLFDTKLKKKKESDVLNTVELVTAILSTMYSTVKMKSKDTGLHTSIKYLISYL